MFRHLADQGLKRPIVSGYLVFILAFGATGLLLFLAVIAAFLIRVAAGLPPMPEALKNIAVMSALALGSIAVPVAVGLMFAVRHARRLAKASE